MAKKKSKKNQNKKQNSTFVIILTIIGLIVFGYFYKDKIADIIDTGTNADVSGKFAVHYIDIGQGDSMLLQTPDNEYMLIDTGEYEYYDKLSSYLEHYNIKKFKYVIFTHPHSDHMGSADKIVKNYEIENLIMPDATNNTKTFERLVTEIENKNLDIILPVPGDKYKFGESEFIILAPISEEYKNLNNYSIVIKLTYGKNKFLFTGDMEKESENEVMDFCKKNNIDLSVDVLKLAHHGSSTSSQQSFLNLINPRYAVIMCGVDNTYNHPNLKTMERVKSTGAEILRTDSNGDIIIVSDGSKLSIKKGRGEFEEQAG